MKLLIATISLALSVMTNAQEAKSIRYNTASGSQIIITDLGLIPGETFSSGLAVNNQPVIVGLANDSTFAFKRPFWDANTGVIIGFADNFNPASTAIPEHVNDSREMAGSEVYGDNVYQGIYWNSTGQAFVLPALAGVDPFYGGLHTRAHGINSLGQLVGTGKEAEPNFYTHAVLWPNKDTEAMDLGFLGQGVPLNYSEAYGINDLTHVVGNSAVGSLIRGFLWRNGQMIDLGALSGQVASEAYAINNTGLIAGKSNFYPVTWTYDIANPNSTPTISQLPIPSGFFTAQPTAVNDSGDVAGYAGSPNIDSHAILWRNGMAIDLGVWPGGHYSVANGINNLGQIVGTGTVAGDNLDHALMWTTAAPVTATSVVSRKTHGTAGAFDINLPLAGTAGIECRSGGGNSDHEVVFTFASAVTLTGATVTPQAGMSGTMSGAPNISPDGRTVTLGLTNVTDAQTIAITLSGVSNGTSTNDVTVLMSLLIGDTNGDGVANSGDALQTRSRSGQATAATNFRSDVNTDGGVNSGDTTLVRSRSGTALPHAFVIGQHYGGGIIFWIDGSGQHGLIAAESDQGFNWWGDRFYFVTGATGTALGTGAVNTGRIINTQGRQYIYAALLCVDYRGGGFADWFLPSKDELYLLYQQKDVVGGFIRGAYWSSSESDVDHTVAWTKFFYNNDQVVSHRDRFDGVRAIRAF